MTASSGRRRFVAPLVVGAAVGLPLVIALAAASGAGPLPPLFPNVVHPLPLLAESPPPPPPREEVAPMPAQSIDGPQSAYASWASTVSGRTGIPARALESYAVAEARLAKERPGCGLGWVTLAGIGAIESDHGRHGERTLAGDATSSPPIVGPRLDGAPGVKAIRDTDDGRVDGDPVWDRAVGPLQFIPTTWADWVTDGDGNGDANPHDLDDAAVAAGRYLCASGGDLGTGSGWTAAVLSYNHTDAYVRAVHDRATAYATASRG